MLTGEAAAWVWPEPRPDPRGDPLPDGLAETPAGPELSAALASIDRTRLIGHDLVALLQAWSRQVAHDQAQFHAVVAETAHATEGDTTERSPVVVEYTSDEIRAALHLTRRAADTTLELALGLQRLPGVWEALHDGRVDLPRVRVFCEGTDHLEESTAREAVDVVLGAAVGLTTGQLAARLRKVTLGLDPDDATRRYETAVEQRCVVLHQGADGTAQLVASHLPADKAVAAMRHVNRLAHQSKREGDPRSIDQLRVDITLDLMCGQGEAAGEVGWWHGRHHRRPRHPGRSLRHTGGTQRVRTGGGRPNPSGSRTPEPTQWRVRVTHPDDGDLLWNGVTKRRPTTGLRRQVEARSPTCVFPGCRMPATQCDLDHTIDHAHGGPTSEANLEPLCRHDHNVKHHAGWILQRTPNGYTWTSRLGHKYHTGHDPP